MGIKPYKWGWNFTFKCSINKLEPYTQLLRNKHHRINGIYSPILCVYSYVNCIIVNGAYSHVSVHRIAALVKSQHAGYRIRLILLWAYMVLCIFEVTFASPTQVNRSYSPK